MKKFEVKKNGSELNPIQTLYANSVEAAQRWANRTGYRILRQIELIIVK